MLNQYEEYIPQNLSIYEFLKKESKDYKDNTAISFYGLNFTYEKMYEEIDRVAKALVALGVKKDDIVASSLPGIPEGVYLIYAINKIGARYCAFDCRSKEADIKETIEMFNPKLCFIPDFQLNDCDNIHDCKIVHIHPANAIGKMMKPVAFFADLFRGRKVIQAKHKNVLSYDEFISNASSCDQVPGEKSTDNIFGYFYTSGTTYGRKSIILTNENINAAAVQYKKELGHVNVGDSILNIMPLFTCYSVTIATHLPLLCGVRVNLIPLINPKKMKQALIKNKPNYIITVPAHWEYFAKEKFDGCDLSFLKVVIVGGDVIDPKQEDKVNDIFKRCGSSAYLIIGYGLSETTSSASANINNPVRGTVGRPLSYTKVAIFDKDTGEQLPVNERGEICICAPTVCKGYFKEKEMTDKLLRTHEDGVVWLHSGDFGYLDEEGYLHFCERIKRMYVRFDGTKVSPYSIEQVISTCPVVSRCMVVSIRDKDHSHGKCAKAIVVLKEEFNNNKGKDKFNHFINENLGMHMIPKEVVYVEKLPYTKNGKLDYFAGEQL